MAMVAMTELDEGKRPGRWQRRAVRGALVAVAIAALGWAVGARPGEPAGEPAAGVEVVFLANEGFLLRPVAGGDAVLIDGFVSEEYSVYGALPAEATARLEAAEPPFDRVRLALASHVHRDHFQARPAARFLAAQPLALLASSAQVLEALAAAGGDGAGEQLRTVSPAAGETVAVEHAGLRAEILRLPHSGRRHASIENLGHVIHVGGRTVLHIGDAAEDAAQFARYRLAERSLDVALIPYWYFFSAEGKALVADQLAARHTIAAHIPPAEVEEVRRALAESHPQVVVLAKALESRSF